MATGALPVEKLRNYLRQLPAGARALLTAELERALLRGEELTYRGRGAFVCISPWNFPLAIFLGQISAALAAGNSVIAKPAEQTPLVAAEAVRLLHAAGVPPSALHLVPGNGRVGALLVEDPRTAGVAFTGSTETAANINRALAAKSGPLVPLIAETGGINAMVVDATALPEQVTDDVLTSAFRSAGQRCSALRLLCVQEDVADAVLAMIEGAVFELEVGDPRELSTHIGPVIDAEAKTGLEQWIARMRGQGRVRFQWDRLPLPSDRYELLGWLAAGVAFCAAASNAACPGVDGIVSKRVNVAVVPARDGSVETAEQQPAPGGYQRIASVSELEPYGQFSKWVGDHDVLVFRHNGEIKALSNICPHFGGPVGYHQMKDGVFTCLWHNYRFEGASGRCLNNAHLCLRAYKVKVEDGGIWVQLVESRET